MQNDVSPMKDVVTAKRCDVVDDSYGVDAGTDRVGAERGEVTGDCSSLHPGEDDLGSLAREDDSRDHGVATRNRDVIADEHDLVSRDHVVIRPTTW